MRGAWLAFLGVAFLSFGAFAAAGGAAPTGTKDETPENRSPPRIEGAAQVGRILEADRGRWRRDRRALFSFQWRLCDAEGEQCADVTGATDRIYPVRAEDVGRRLLVAVTATTDAGEKSASSRPTAVVRAAAAGAPIATARPTVEGTIEPGGVLMAESGTWQGEEPMRFRYRWRRCLVQGGACVYLDRTSQTYRLTPRDEGHTLRVLVRAENAVGAGAALSDPTAAVPGGVPRNTSPPVISGVPVQGRTLTASSGTWSGTTPMRFHFQWRRCARAGDDCVSIRRATDQTYTLAGADVGRTIRVRVVARNAAGSGSAVSARTEVVVGATAPVNTAAPTITGTARVGRALTVSPGRWKGDQPITFRYQWLRCGTGGGACAAIPRATGRTRTLGSVDIGRTLRVRVTATNAGGSSSVLSGPSPVVVARGTAPANREAPVLSGTALQGERLRLSNGVWAGTSPLTFSYRWMRCDASLSGCRTIGGATGNGYVLTRADVGHRLFGVVTVSNVAGASSASSNATSVVVGAPLNTSLPTIEGTPVEGRTLTARSGGWAGVTPIGFGYQWTRCNAQGTFASCVPIVVTSRRTYTLRAADVGRRVFVQVKAYNRFGASFVNSALTDVVAAAPVGTVTARAVQSLVVYGKGVVLTGRAVGAQPGDVVTIVERPVRGRARVYRAAAVISQAGTWTFFARPTIRTTYFVQVRGRTSAPVLVRVRPRLRLGRVAPGRVSLRIFAARSFGGRMAILQRWNGKRRRWVNVRRVRLTGTRIGEPPTRVTAATIRTRLPRRTLVRVVLPSRQAGLGYPTARSNRVRA